MKKNWRKLVAVEVMFIDVGRNMPSFFLKLPSKSEISVYGSFEFSKFEGVSLVKERCNPFSENGL